MQNQKFADIWFALRHSRSDGHMHLKDKITMRLRPFCAAVDLGPTKVYKLIEAGEIKSFTSGKARLVVVQSYLDYIDRQAQSAAPLPSPNPRAPSRMAAAQASTAADQQLEARRRGPPPGAKSKSKALQPPQRGKSRSRRPTSAVAGRRAGDADGGSLL
jgi:hypothetical protein